MKSLINYVAFAAVFPSRISSQPWGGNSGGGFGGWVGDFPSCASSCSPQWDISSCSDSNWGDCICKNETVIANVNSCISSSSCSDSDKFSTYQKIASLCAAAGTTITAAPEASFTGSLLSVTNGPFPTGFSNSNGGPFSNGPFGGGGNWGSWTAGPWTAWWGGKGCPDASWTGWTSGSWTSSAEWTSWTACTASTTATTTFTTTNTAGAVVTGTGVEIKVQEQGSGTVSSRAGERSLLFGVYGFVISLMLMMALL